MHISPNLHNCINTWHTTEKIQQTPHKTKKNSKHINAAFPYMGNSTGVHFSYHSQPIEPHLSVFCICGSEFVGFPCGWGYCECVRILIAGRDDSTCQLDASSRAFMLITFTLQIIWEMKVYAKYRGMYINSFFSQIRFFAMINKSFYPFLQILKNRSLS